MIRNHRVLQIVKKTKFDFRELLSHSGFGKSKEILTCLDIGSGNGSVCQESSNEFKLLSCYEPAYLMAIRLRKNGFKPMSKAAFYNLPSDSYDVVSLLNVLDVIPDPPSLLNRMRFKFKIRSFAAIRSSPNASQEPYACQ